MDELMNETLIASGEFALHQRAFRNVNQNNCKHFSLKEILKIIYIYVGDKLRRNLEETGISLYI